MKTRNYTLGKQYGVVLSFLAVPLLFVSTAEANRFTSPNYTIDASTTGSSIAGPQASTSYKLVSTGGETTIGNASGGSYKLGTGYVAQLEKSLQLTAQPSELLAYYPFEEPLERTVLDFSGTNAHLRVAGSPTQTTGKIGSAFRSGDNHSAQLNDGSPLNTGTLTASAWLLNDGWNTVDQNGTAVGRQVLDSPVDGDWMIGRTAGQRFRFRITVNNVGYTIQSTDKQPNQWYHVTGTYDGTTVRIYVNGVEENSQTVNGGALPSTSTPFAIGQRGNQTNPYWNGAIDEVKIYGRALSSDEVQTEYAAQNLGVPAGVAFAAAVTPGISQTAALETIVQTDAPGYSLSIHQNANLTSGGATIPGVSSSIASPAAWSEGTTKGLGFTLYETNATPLPAKWNGGTSYAAFPSSPTSFYVRSGYTSGAKDILKMRLRLDVPSAQATGQYSNQVTITGTMTP